MTTEREQRFPGPTVRRFRVRPHGQLDWSDWSDFADVERGEGWFRVDGEMYDSAWQGEFEVSFSAGKPLKNSMKAEAT